MLVAISVADSYAVAFEYAPDEFVTRCNDFKGYYANPNKAHRKPLGEYSDDTQMSIAIAECVAEHLEHGFSWTPLAIADKFVAAFKRCQIKGYSQRFQKLLEDVADGAELLQRIVPNSDKSGAAMRGATIGYLHTAEEVEHLSAIQAKVTHDTADGVAAAVAAALMAHYVFHHVARLEHMGEWLQSRLERSGLPVSDGVRWDQPWPGGRVGAKGWMAVRAAITAIKECVKDSETANFHDLIVKCVSFGGDTDTVAVIAAGAMQSEWKVGSDKREMLHGIAPKCHGLSFLRNLEDRVYNRL